MDGENMIFSTGSQCLLKPCLCEFQAGVRQVGLLLLLFSPCCLVPLLSNMTLLASDEIQSVWLDVSALHLVSFFKRKISMYVSVCVCTM